VKKRNRQSVIGDIIERHGLRYGAEIGVGTGPTTAALLGRFPDLQWLAVDHWPAGYPLHHGGFITAERQAVVRGKFMAVMNHYGDRLKLIEKPSLEAAESVEDGLLDLVFIDADHSYEGCKADIDAWRPKLRPGGWLMGHDYCTESFPGVVQAVKEMVPDATLHEDFVWMAQA
jgi:hypothetical protein